MGDSMIPTTFFRERAIAYRRILDLEREADALDRAGYPVQARAKRATASILRALWM